MSLGLSLGLFTFAFLLAAGQILFKIAAERVPNVSGLSDVAPMLSEPVLWLALALYGGATLLWIVLLQRVPLTYAYPFAALAFVLVPLAAAVFLGERVEWTFYIGAALIVAGICVCAAASS